MYTAPHIARVVYFKGNSIPTTVRGTVYTYFVYTFPQMAKAAFFKGSSIPTTVRGTVSRGGHFTINSYGGVRRKDFCYDPIPEIWSDIDTQSQNICQILIPNRRSNKSNSTSKG